ncbi:hypothetical protein E2C01_028421 [Portunus trituberculatus]|uniref:Uncharacterized protein n=1 Tax=Portunus trituberculatus TaxID=210409 RepID=A0A5B7ERN2_PORTR|nr:hypothetical protein [Portunus trituberculatus]
MPAGVVVMWDEARRRYPLGTSFPPSPDRRSPSLSISLSPANPRLPSRLPLPASLSLFLSLPSIAYHFPRPSDGFYDLTFPLLKASELIVSKS